MTWMAKRKKYSDKPYQVLPRSSTTSALRFRVLAGVTIIIVTAFIAYLPSINGGFVFDDDGLLAENDLVQAPDGLYRFWFTTEAFDYWPVTNTTFWIEWRIWGMNSTGYHVTNLILHVAEALLIWVVLRKLMIPGAFFAAIIFAVHPVNVESVAWIASRKNTMAMLFFLLSIFCYLEDFASSGSENDQCNRHNPSTEPARGACGVLGVLAGHWYWLSLVAFVLAMLSKGSVAILPVLLLWLVWWLRPLTRRDMAKIAPYLIVAVLFTGVNVWFQTHGVGELHLNAGFTERLLGAGGVVWFYLSKAFLPINLAFVYPQWHINNGNPLWWLPLSAALVVTAILWRCRNSWSRPFLFAWGCFCIALIPVMGFTDVGFMEFSLVADRYQHISLIGVVALAAAGFGVWHQRVRGIEHWSTVIVAVAAVGALAFLTSRQCEIYQNKITLYSDTLEKNPNCWMAHNNLGAALIQIGQSQGAIEHYEQALLLKSDYFDAHNNLGFALAQTRRPREALEHYEQAIQLKPDNPGPYNSLGAVLFQTGRPQEAIEYYKKALRLNADFPEAHNNLGLAFKSAGQSQQAIEHYEKALRLKPDYLEAHINLGCALAETNQIPEAIEQFNKALQLRHDTGYVYFNLALAYARMNQSSEAIDAGQKAFELARSHGQTSLAKQIEDWLNTYRTSR